VAVTETIDPVPQSAYPVFTPVTTPAPSMPEAWTAVVLLHPFSPPLRADPKPDNPFFQLCVGAVDYVAGEFLSARVKGCIYGEWWYLITPSGTRVSTDGGLKWTDVDLGWTLPVNWFGSQAPAAQCAGSSPLNWMVPRSLDWWKVPVPLGANSPPGATWMWFDSDAGDPMRMMFGDGPPKPTMGDPTQLAFFQMFSFTYFASFRSFPAQEAPPLPKQWSAPSIPGFRVGNPDGYKPFVWNTNFAMTVFSTPVNGNFNPLPTRILYVWKSDTDYKVYTDRAQSTLMLDTYNAAPPGGSKPAKFVEALLTGPAPAGVPPPPHSQTGFLYTVYTDGSTNCLSGKKFPFPQEAPTWASTPRVKGTIQATIADNPALCPGHVVTVYSMLFPPAANYPEGTYLWTWYSPIKGSDGTQSRPVTFMQSQSGVNLGTSLALDDYFYYEDLAKPIDPGNFLVPAACIS
jgi:hypothetical protein